MWSWPTLYIHCIYVVLANPIYTLYIYVVLANPIYTLYICGPGQPYIYTVYMWCWPTLYIHCIYMWSWPTLIIHCIYVWSWPTLIIATSSARRYQNQKLGTGALRGITTTTSAVKCPTAEARRGWSAAKGLEVVFVGGRLKCAKWAWLSGLCVAVRYEAWGGWVEEGGECRAGSKETVDGSVAGGQELKS